MLLIAARSENNVIGSGPNIPWSVKGEQRIFREITLDNTLVMGRKTFDSIGRVLPARDTVIITRQPDFSIPDCHIASTLHQALDIASDLRGEVFIAGGGDVYRQTIDLADGIHLTTIHTFADGDILFPEFDVNQFELITSRRYESNIDYTYEFYQRKPVEA